MEIRQIEPLEFDPRNVRRPRAVYVIVNKDDVCEKKCDKDNCEHYEYVYVPKDKIKGSRLNILA